VERYRHKAGGFCGLLNREKSNEEHIHSMCGGCGRDWIEKNG
jgi:hypothetical protein